MKKVSILTPCYNGEKYLDTYFQSLLNQSYTNCELIFMDDGSTDGTKALFDKYKPLLEQSGYDVHYHFHENMGLGWTIAEGIKYVTGEYLVWPDCDDIMFADFIFRKLDFLESHKEYGLVRSDGLIVDENDLENVLRYCSKKNAKRFESDLFETYLLGDGENAWLMPLSFMVRMSSFDEANPRRYIYGTRFGQDWQMLLPVMKKYPCGYIDEPLFKYVLHAKSLSNINKDSFENQIGKQLHYEIIITETLKAMDLQDSDYWISKVRNRYLGFYIDMCFDFGQKARIKAYYKEYQDLFGFHLKYYLKSIICGNAFFYKLLTHVRSGKK